ncbi:MAG: permease-like cell division protein FtsX [Candidatus Gracilibacteria bacterium]
MISSSSFRRSLHLALDNLFRNKFLTFGTVLVMALILFIFNIIFSVNSLAQNAIQDLKAKVDLILYLEDNADSLRVNQLVKDLDTFPETTTVTYTSKEQALQDFLKKYSEEMNPFSTYDLENPLPASIQIITQSPEDHETILTYLAQEGYNDLLLDTESRAENAQIVDNLLKVTDFSQKILLGIVIAFILGSTLIIANVIQVTIFHRKREIKIMRLVGAGINFIRSPFMIEGAIYGMSSVVLSFGFFLIFDSLVDLSSITFSSGEIHYASLLLFQIAAGLFLGVLSSLIAINHYLKQDLISGREPSPPPELFLESAISEIKIASSPCSLRTAEKSHAWPKASGKFPAAAIHPSNSSIEGIFHYGKARTTITSRKPCWKNVLQTSKPPWIVSPPLCFSRNWWSALPRKKPHSPNFINASTKPYLSGVFIRTNTNAFAWPRSCKSSIDWDSFSISGNADPVIIFCPKKTHFSMKNTSISNVVLALKKTLDLNMNSRSTPGKSFIFYDNTHSWPYYNSNSKTPMS